MNMMLACITFLLNAILALGLTWVYATDRCSHWPDLLVVTYFLLNAYYAYYYLTVMS